MTRGSCLGVVIFVGISTLLETRGSCAEGGAAAPPSTTPAYLSIEAVIPGTVSGPYSNRLPQVLKHWPLKQVPDVMVSPHPLWMKGIRTQENATYVGVLKALRIDAPLDRVAGLLEDFEGYKVRDPELRKVKITSRKDNVINVFWERNSPAFFVPNTKWDQAYLVDRKPGRTTYRYQLISGNSLKHSDGLIVLEPRGNSTLLTAFDFFDASWGLLGSVGSGKIWSASVEGYAKGDLALKVQAENPDWDSKQILKEASRLNDLSPVLPVQYIDFHWDSN